mgnify:FL=1|tara:strand:- start:12 stop:296 length:285 start_codon:yes stop_codon:yes gene_type:complete
MPQRIEVNLETGDVATLDLTADQITALNELKAGAAAQYWHELRGERNRLLAASDFSQLADAAVDAAAWATYRQALRDLPANTPDPTDVTWPEVE